jgi:NADPH:quinone reductase-like Zn-dependent oxidoreductase
VKIPDLFNVDGYGVVVTGGASGIGLGYAEALAANGARVTILDVDAQQMEKEIKRLRAAGLDVRGQAVDVTDHKALDGAVDGAVREYGRLDVMFANAGIDPGVGFLGRIGKASHPGGRSRKLLGRALEPGNRNQHERRVRDNSRGREAHEAEKIRPHHCYDIPGRNADRARDRRRLHDCQSRDKKLDAKRRHGACRIQHYRERDRPGLYRHQHRRRPCAQSR